jgi:5-formyltetrahydrofolate cyclo-ligase
MLPPPALPLVHWKKAFRERAKMLRADAAERQTSAAKFAASYFMAGLEPKEGQAVALYHPAGDELDTAPLAAALAEAGAAVLLPVVIKKNAPLTFRLFEIDRPLVRGRYGIMEPPSEAESRTPDIVVTPLLAVRPDGARLGMGGGYYDRTLAVLRQEGEVLAVGYGYAAQMMDRFPVGPEDQFLDGFVSEQGYRAFERRR